MKSRFSMTVAALIAAMVSFPLMAVESATRSPGTTGGRPAVEEAKRGETQKQMKERVLQHIDARIRILQTAKSCVQAANNTAAMVVCHAQERKQTKALRDKDRREIQAIGSTPR